MSPDLGPRCSRRAPRSIHLPCRRALRARRSATSVFRPTLGRSMSSGRAWRRDCAIPTSPNIRLARESRSRTFRNLSEHQVSHWARIPQIQPTDRGISGSLRLPMRIEIDDSSAELAESVRSPAGDLSVDQRSARRALGRRGGDRLARDLGHLHGVGGEGQRIGSDPERGGGVRAPTEETARREQCCAWFRPAIFTSTTSASK